MTRPHLLPSNRGSAEEALARAAAEGTDIAVPVDTLWSADRCPAHLLPWLAWALSVDDWDPAWSVPVQRAVIAASVGVHRLKGTRAGVRAALEAMGYGGATIIEAHELPLIGPPAPAGRGEPLGTGWRLGWPGTHWADYWVEIVVPIFRRDADALARRLRTVAPVRCRLRGIALVGARHELGAGIWTLGTDVPIGGVYNYEV